MKIIYLSFTGNARRFIRRAELGNTFEITAENYMKPVHEPFIIVTGTIGFGEVSEPVQSFLEANHQYIRSMTVSGNRNWELSFAKVGRAISEKCGVLLLMRFELYGKDKDVIESKNKVGNFSESHGREKVQSCRIK